jgi:O-antigen/teichoic acid export membrane protein
LLLYAFQGPLSVVLQGFERINYTSTYNVLNQIIFIVVGGFLLWQGWGVPGVIIASFCGIIGITLFSWRTARQLTDLPIEITPQTWPSLLRAGLPFSIITFATMLSFKVDTVLLSLWRSPAEVGWYNVAYNLIFSLLILSSSFNSTLVPSLSRQYRIDPASVDRFYIRAVRLLWTVSLPIAVGTTLLADRLIVLLYGAEYAPAGLALRILIWVLPVLTLTSLCGSITTVFHRERATARINIINAAFNIGFNLWAVPFFGLLGAAIMTVATEVLGLIQYTLLLRDVFPLRTIAVAFRAPLLAAVLMGIVILLTWSLPLGLIICIGAAIYGVALVLSGGLKIAELKNLTSIVTSSFGRRRATTTEL